MADDQNRALVFAEQFLEQVERLDVEVVGRLVEHDQVRGEAERAGEHQAAALAARQLLDRRARLLGPEQEVLHVADDMPALAVDGDVIAAAAGQRVDQGGRGRQRVALLVHARHRHVGPDADLAGIGRERAGQEVDQRRLARAVGADTPIRSPRMMRVEKFLTIGVSS